MQGVPIRTSSGVSLFAGVKSTTRNMIHRCIGILSISLLAGAGFAADPLDSVFARIDAAAKTFKGMTADITNTQHTALVDDNDVKTGTIKILRGNGGEMRMLVMEKGPSGVQEYAVNGHDARTYNPNTKIVDVYDLTSRQGLVNQFLLLGFGITSTEMKSGYDVSFVGDEKVGTQDASHLKLVPKAAETRHNLKQADLWYGSNGMLVQQKLFYPNGDFWLITYSNPKPGILPVKELELNPSGATITKH